jgi:hypothetical protein
VPAAQRFSLAIGDTIAPGRPAKGAGNIESPGAQDNYAFTADKGQRIYLDVRECAATGRLGLNSTRSLGQIRGLSGHAADADCAAW